MLAASVHLYMLQASLLHCVYSVNYLWTFNFAEHAVEFLSCMLQQLVLGTQVFVFARY